MFVHLESSEQNDRLTVFPTISNVGSFCTDPKWENYLLSPLNSNQLTGIRGETKDRKPGWARNIN